MRCYKILSRLFLIALVGFVCACSDEKSLSEDIGLPEMLRLYPGDGVVNAPVDVVISVTFRETVASGATVSNNGVCSGAIQVSLSDNKFSTCVKLNAPSTRDNKTFTIKPVLNLDLNSRYKIKVLRKENSITYNFTAVEPLCNSTVVKSHQTVSSYSL